MFVCGLKVNMMTKLTVSGKLSNKIVTL